MVMKGVKATEEGQERVPGVCQMVVYIDHTPYHVFRNRPLQRCPQLFCCCMFNFVIKAIVVTGDEGSHKVTEEGQVRVPAACQMV
jgi:hypothetical protein